MKITKLNFAASCIALFLLTAATFAQTTAFSYQGRLSEAGNPVTGTRYFRFTLFDENGTAIPGGSIDQTLTVTNGVFNASLDFVAVVGALAFPGANRSLQISVKINAGDPFTDLTPRQDILAAPYSIKSKEAENAVQLGGVDSSGFVQQDPGGNVSIGGNLTVAGAVTYDTVNATTQYNLGGQRILAINSFNLSLGQNTGNPNSGNFNTLLGQSAGQMNTAGSNTFVGAAAGFQNTTGGINSFVGSNAGYSNTTGGGNIFIGYAAGAANTTGAGNTFVGTNAGSGCVPPNCPNPSTGSNNSFFGFDTGKANTTGYDNAFFGQGAGQANTIGYENSFFGKSAGLRNTTGFRNSFLGINAGINNTTGADNVFFGAGAGTDNQAGSENTFVGVFAGQKNTAGRNSFFGAGSGQENKTGMNNSFFGFVAGISNQTGRQNSFFGSNAGAFNNADFNSFFGAAAGQSNTTGTNNTFVGTSSGLLNQTGSQNSFFGRDAGRNNLAGFNSFFGFSAGSANTNGSNNAYFGNSAGLSNITGNNNAYFGTGAGDTATGSGNTAIGDNAGVTFFVGTTNTNGNYNTFLGSLARPSIGNLTNANAIGAYAFVSANNSMILGSINGINGATADTNVGIGTTAPQTRLQIKTVSGNYGFTQTDGAITVGSYVGGSSSGATGGWLGTQSNNKLFFFTNNGQPSMTVDTTGNVGIGTISPASKFTVAGLIETTLGGVKFPDGTIQTSAVTATSNSFIQNSTTPQSGANFNIAGNGTVGGTLTANKVQATSDSFVLGSFGIGTSAPRAKLDVTGGNILIDTAGSGIILKSPDGNTCRILTISDAGAVALTPIACP